MREYYPLLVVGAAVSVFALVFILAYVFMKGKKEVGSEMCIRDRAKRKR